MIAQLRRFTDRLVDDRVEGDGTANELALNRLCLREFGSREPQSGSKSARDFGRERSEQRGQASWSVTGIGGGEYQSGTNDADYDLAAPTDGKQKSGICINPA